MRHRRALRRLKLEMSFDLECYANIGSRGMSSADFSIMSSILKRDTYKFSSKHIPILRPDQGLEMCFDDTNGTVLRHVSG